MPQRIEEPVTTQETPDKSVTTNPAFCQIGAARVSGSTALYDSDFRHNHYMTIAIRQELVSNPPFMAKQFDEHTETTVEKAKQEIHGYMNSVIHRAGIAALQGEGLPLRLESPEAPEAE